MSVVKTHSLAAEWPGMLAVASVALAVALGSGLFAVITNPVVLALLSVWLFAVILLGAHAVSRHAEVLSNIYREPVGTLILTFSVVVIEAVMISAILFHDSFEPVMPRNTFYATLMILVNGFLGLAIIIGGIKHGELRYNLKSSRMYFSLLLALWGLNFFLPAYLPQSAIGPYKVFVAVLSLILFGIFLTVQLSQRLYFFHAPKRKAGAPKRKTGPAAAGLRRSPAYHIGMLLVTLSAIAYLAKLLGEVIDEGVDLLKVPRILAPILVAALVMSPKAIEAIRAGLHDDMQRVINICLGAALGTVSLALPAVLVMGLIADQPISLALTPVQQVIVALTILLGINNYQGGDVSIMAGTVHFALFAAFLATAFLI